MQQRLVWPMVSQHHPGELAISGLGPVSSKKLWMQPRHIPERDGSFCTWRGLNWSLMWLHKTFGRTSVFFALWRILASKGKPLRLPLWRALQVMELVEAVQRWERWFLEGCYLQQRKDDLTRKRLRRTSPWFGWLAHFSWQWGQSIWANWFMRLQNAVSKDCESWRRATSIDLSEGGVNLRSLRSRAMWWWCLKMSELTMALVFRPRVHQRSWALERTLLQIVWHHYRALAVVMHWWMILALALLVHLRAP